jgi:hypothetical protein
MIDQWLKMCQYYVAKPAHFYSGARKIIQATTYSFDSLGPTLAPGDIGYTKSKMTMLRRLYRHEESIAVAKRLWDKRLERGTYGSVSFTTYNHFIKAEKTSIRGSVMGPCIQAVSLTLTPDGTVIDAFYRTTELFKKFPADLIFLRDDLLDGFPLPNLYRITFYFANVTAHPMYFVTLIPHLKEPVYELDKIKDDRFRRWSIKWTARYLCPQYGNGIEKFSQALRVRKHALSSISPKMLDGLRLYLEDHYEEIPEPEGSDD